MRLLPTITLAAALVAVAGPLSAQQADAYDAAAQITLEGDAETVVWSMSEGRLILKPNGEDHTWEVALPRSSELIAKGITAEVLSRGAPVKVRALKAKDGACDPNCKAKAVELTLPRQGKTFAFQGAGNAG